jgi:outer membrane protein
MRAPYILMGIIIGGILSSAAYSSEVREFEKENKSPPVLAWNKDDQQRGIKEVKESSETWGEFEMEILEQLSFQPSLEKAQYSLVDLIDLSLMNDSSTRQAWANAKSSREQWSEDKGSLYPSLSASATGTRQRIPLKSFQSLNKDSVYTSSSRPEVTGSWNVFDFGATQAGIKKSLYDFLYEQRNYNWTLQGTVKTVIASYYQFLGAQATLKSKEAALKDSSATLESVKELKEAGVDTLADLLQAQSNYSQSIMELEAAKGNVKITLGSLCVAVGIPATTEFEVMIPLHEPKKEITLAGLDELIKKAEKSRQDLLAVKAEVGDKEMSLEKAKKSQLPQLTLSYDAGENYYNSDSVTSSSGYDATASLSVSVPIFSGFSQVHNVRKKKYQLLASKASYDSMKAQVDLDVLTYYYNMQTANKNLNYSKDYLGYSQQNYEVNSQSFKAGKVSLLDLLAAQSSLAQARQTRVESITNWYTTLAELIFSVGVLELPKSDDDWLTLLDFVEGK